MHGILSHVLLLHGSQMGLTDEATLSCLEGMQSVSSCV